MPILASHRHEQFAQGIASGESGAAAYRATYGAKGTSAEAAASRLLRNGKVRARVLELQAEAAKACVLTIEKRRELLARFAQSDTEKTADRIRALELDARLAGELKCDAVTVSATAVSGCVMTPERQAELIAKKRAATMRRLAREAEAQERGN